MVAAGWLAFDRYMPINRDRSTVLCGARNMFSIRRIKMRSQPVMRRWIKLRSVEDCNTGICETHKLQDGMDTSAEDYWHSGHIPKNSNLCVTALKPLWLAIFLSKSWPKHSSTSTIPEHFVQTK